MKEYFKLEKELLFKNNIKDITSISLDRDFKIDGNEVKGNFLINGEYKIHELSINREKFNFKIPFKHELKDDIDRESVDVEIVNFVYDYNKDELMVNIEYEIGGDRKDVLIFDDEESLDEFLQTREIEVVDTRVEEIKDIVSEKDKEDSSETEEDLKDEDKIEKVKKEKTDDETEKIEDTKRDINETREETLELEKNEEEERNIKQLFENSIFIKPEKKESDILNKEQIIDVEKENVEIKIEDTKEKIETEEIVNNIGTVEDKFITYKIYKISEIDTLESLVIKFHTTLDELKEYNDLSNINIGDKLIIPYYE